MSATTAGDISNRTQLTRIEARLDDMQTTTDARFERMNERFEPLERIAENLELLATVAATALDLIRRAFRVAKWAGIVTAAGALGQVGHVLVERLVH